ncbi:hypothetical protein BKA69DRAFT_1126348 [Paraphysoderma sedebokerense]|nr:hypothetical protein BKA69DRAFT_1126348 [Paraphysoderma sedebokerense]
MQLNLMKVTTLVVLGFVCISASVFAAPTPQDPTVPPVVTAPPPAPVAPALPGAIPIPPVTASDSEFETMMKVGLAAIAEIGRQVATGQYAAAS